MIIFERKFLNGYKIWSGCKSLECSGEEQTERYNKSIERHPSKETKMENVQSFLKAVTNSQNKRGY